jgi:hypothetical protein
MALTKISIDGLRLKIVIRERGDTIKGVATKAKIGEKTMHRLLNGDEIRRDKVEKIFELLKLPIEDFVQNSDVAEQNNKSSDGYRFTGSSEITLSGFEIPDFKLLPLTLTWRLDVPSPNQDQLAALQTFNQTLSEYLETERDNYVDFDTEFTKLSMGYEISKAVKGIRELGVYSYFGVYTKWHSRDKDMHDPYESQKLGVERIYRSQNLMAILMTTRVRAGTVKAFVDKGERPYDFMFNDSRRFIRTLVDNAELHDLPENSSPESYFGGIPDEIPF